MRKILIVAPTFFPDQVVGGIRVTQWARLLPEFGWKPLILCRHHGHTATPELLASELHPAIELAYLGPQVPPPDKSAARTKKQSSLKELLLKPLVDTVAVPDALVWKWKGFTTQAIEIAQRWKPDVVLSSSPPHSIHALGRVVARATGAPWIADFRDPYLIDSRYGPVGLKRFFNWRHQGYDRAIYRDAALAIHAIPLHGRWASRRYPSARHKIRILTNGIPSDLLEELRSTPHDSTARSPRASIRAIGVLGRGALELIGAAMRQLLAGGVDAEFRHVGRATDAADAIPAELRDRIVLRGSVPHRDALREAAGADVLLKYEDPERARSSGLSSKLFEYLATGQPIVAINTTVPDRQLIGRLSWCWCLEDPSPSQIAAALEQAITTGAKPPQEWLTAFRQQYNRRNQTQQLAGWLDELVR
jgi:glycosyltransferase involved in cell wall biosynthesis